MRIIALLLVQLAVSGCAAQKTLAAPQSDYAGGQPAQSASLFSGDAAILSDADIEKILKFKYTPPKQTRVAVLALGQPIWLGYSDELARGGEEVRQI